MNTAVDVLLGGAVIGVFYGLIGLGFGLLDRVGGSNLGYGDAMVLSGFAAAVVAVATSQPLLAIAAGIGTGIALALAAERVALRPLVGNPLSAIVATVGLALIWRDASQELALNGDVSIGGQLQSMHRVIAGVSIDAASLLALGALVVVSVAAVTVPRTTTWGRRARAVADDRVGAAICGIAVTRTVRPLHAVSGAVGAVTVLLLVAHLGVLSVNLGWQLTLVGFVAATLGGRRGPGVAAVGGFLLGILQTAVQVWVGSVWAGVASLAALAIVLLARPNGFVSTQGARP